MPQMADFYTSSSRCKDMVLPNLIVAGGAPMERLVRIALCKRNRRMMRENVTRGRNFMYMVGGIPDITDKIKDIDQHYEEVIFTHTPHRRAREVIRKYERASAAILETGTIPVFATIATMSLQNWNEWRYNEGYTSYFLHSEYYDDMQYFLNTTVEIINNAIFGINDTNLVETPHLAGHIQSKRGAGQGYRVRYSRLYDGCHPGWETIEKWQETLAGVAAINRETHYFR